MAIHFHTIDIDYSLKHKNALKRWINACVLEESRQLKCLEIVFCSDEHLLAINKKFLNHDYYTDIITFNYNNDTTISGDLYISLPRVFENASQFNERPHIELYRVIIHGVMHLCGYKDKSKKDAKLMRQKEDNCLNKISKYLS
jgi:rRNA maturation RNase YbeY